MPSMAEGQGKHSLCFVISWAQRAPSALRKPREPWDCQAQGRELKRTLRSDLRPPRARAQSQSQAVWLSEQLIRPGPELQGEKFEEF